jgi:hypothetical protein
MPERSSGPESTLLGAEEGHHVAGAHIDPCHLIAGWYGLGPRDRLCATDLAQEHLPREAKGIAAAKVELRHSGVLRAR